MDNTVVQLKTKRKPARRGRRSTPKEVTELKGESPIDLTPLEPVPAVAGSDLKGIVADARLAQRLWGQNSLAHRLRLLRKAAKRMLEDRTTAIELMGREIGKLEVDALMSEVLGPLDQVNQWGRVIEKALGRRQVWLNPVSFPKKKAYYDRVPRGVVGIIAPWNYPIANYFRSVFPALLTGNGVVLKPSEYSPRTAQWFVSHLQAVLPEFLIQVVPGNGAVGAALLDAGIDACVFTGSHGSGTKVQVRCAELGIPVSAEMGGKDAAIVLEDCDLDRTTMGITHWALHNVGQACGAIEVVYVDKRIANLFIDRMRRAFEKLTLGPGPHGRVDISPLAHREQLKVVEHHVADARSKGATVVCGGHATGHGLWFQPTLLDNCTADMLAVSEETFGPVLAVVRIDGATQAIDQINQSHYGLGVSLWTQNTIRAERLAERIDAGVITINNHALTGAMPQLPWSGVRQTGHSVASSELSLGIFTRPKTVLSDSNRAPELFWLPYDRDLWELGHHLADAQLGKLKNAWKLPILIQKRLKTIRRFFR